MQRTYLNTPANVPDDQRLLNSREAARMLSISPRTLWSLTSSRQIPHLRIGRAVRYRVGDLKNWVTARMNGGSDQ